MRIIKDEVPQGVKYISDWKEYDLPKGHCIVDKGVTGCGYTELCLVNDKPVILCSPRKLLLENKLAQHEKDTNIMYLKNEIKEFSDVQKFKESVKNHISYCRITLHKSPKFLITYDSTHYIIEALQEIGALELFHFVIDEFQSIFLDSYYKADVEFDFVDYLQVCPNVLYLSATPMLEKYLDKVDEFKDLPFYKLDWSKTGVVENIIIQRKFASSLFKECKKIIEKYLKGDFPIAVVDGNVIFSKEAVFYFNSIADIIKVVKKLELTPDQVNIICADSPDNKAKLSKMSREMGHKNPKFVIGKVPLITEPNKMFTFCTKTAYIGADFYSTCASSFVFADPNIDSLALDISLDLPQIVGRQRLRENPFKNNIVIFYKTIRGEEIIPREAFDKKQEERKEKTNRKLDVYYNDFSDNVYKQQDFVLDAVDLIKFRNYSEDFISISRKTGLPVYNNFIELANERAWEVSQKDYQDIITVTKTLDSISDDVTEFKDDIEKIVDSFLNNQFYKTGIFREKMKLFCEFMDKHRGNLEILNLVYLKIKDSRYKDYYNYYGTDGCRAVRYEEKPLKEGILNLSKEDKLLIAIHNNFKVGDRFTNKYIKLTLKNIYKSLGLTLSPKATDLEKYFKLIRTRITLEDKVIENGLKLEEKEQ